MGRGRKPISNFNGSEWETVFYNSVGTYVQYINIQLSKEYSLEPLSNHLKIVGGYAFKTAEYKNQGIPIIRISDFNNEQIVLKDVVYYQESKELDKYQLIEGDIIIALTGGTIAKLAIVQQGLGKIYLNQRVGKFQTLKPDEFEVEYIYWLARSIQSIIKNLAWGAAIPNVSPKQIEELKFPFPPKGTQRGIIDFLNDLKNNNLKDDKIYFDELIESEIVSLHEKQLTTSSISTELTHQLTLVKKLRQQLLQDAVQGKLVEQNKKDEPANELLKRIRKQKELLIKQKKLKIGRATEQSVSLIDDVKIPKSWQWCKSDEIFFVTKLAGFEYSEHISLKESGDIPVVRAQNVRPLSIDKTNLLYIDAKTSATLARCALIKKCLLVTFIGAGIGDVATFEETERWHLAPNVAKMEPFEGCEELTNVKYLNYYLMSRLGQKEIFKHVKATAQPSLSMGTIRDIDFAIPPLEEQNRIVKKLDELMQHCNQLQASIQQSETQNQQLLQQVLREALKK